MPVGLAWIATFLALPAAGAPFVLAPAFRQYGMAARAVLAGGVAALLMSFLMTLASLAGVAWSPMALYFGSAVLALGLRALVRGQPEEPSPASTTTTTATGDRWAAAIAAVCVLAVLAAERSGALGNPDLLYMWGVKAQRFAESRGIDAAWLAATDHSYMHADYPPLVTNVWAWASMLAGRFPWGTVAMTLPLGLAALALALPGVLRAARSEVAWPATAAIVAAISLLGIRGSIGGTAEIPLVLFEVLAVAVVLGGVPNRAHALLAGLLAAGAASTKVEGLPFAAALALFAALAFRRGTAARLRLFSLLFVPAAVTLAPWFGFGAAHGLFTGYEGYGELLRIYPATAPAVVATIARELAAETLALPFLLPLAVLALARPAGRRWLLPLGIAGVLGAFFLFTYLHLESTWEWIRWSAVRIFTPVAALLILAVAAGARVSAADDGARRDDLVPAGTAEA